MKRQNAIVLLVLCAPPAWECHGQTKFHTAAICRSALDCIERLCSPAARETIVLQRVAVPGTDREMGMGIAEFPPNSSKPRQKSLGPETCYVLRGEVTVEVEGQQTKVFHAGDSFQFPAMVVHQTTAGPEGAKILATWVHVPADQFNIPAPR